jgi:formamidopyrimidine-DNA glycosylase
MPELPETETIARDLDAMIRGAVLTGAHVERPDVLRECPADAWDAAVRDLAVQRVWRRAKLVVLDLARAPSADPAQHLVVQPRFTGALLVDDGALEPALQEYVCVRFPLADGRALLYRDVRRLGTVALMPPVRFAAYTAALGIEPLAPDTTAASLAATFGDSTRPLKAALMDQHRLAGVGNIYATEACWRAALDPSRPVASLDAHEWTRLHGALTALLEASIRARGTSFRDYRDATGARGGFVAQLAAYGRAGTPCPRCGHRLVGTDAIDGRMTVFCAWCQR